VAPGLDLANRRLVRGLSASAPSVFSRLRKRWLPLIIVEGSALAENAHDKNVKQLKFSARYKPHAAPSE
jgi:hypothetical protein